MICRNVRCEAPPAARIGRWSTRGQPRLGAPSTDPALLQRCIAPGGAGAGPNFTDKIDTRSNMSELNYLPIQEAGIALQYTMFTKVRGMSSGHALGPDGVTPRNSKDNNLLYLYTWFAF